MVIVSISELKAKLSEHLRRVRGGEEVLVTDRGRVVARLSPPARPVAEDERVQRLAEAGLVRPGPGIPADFWDLPRPANPDGSVRKALLEEREEGW